MAVQRPSRTGLVVTLGLFLIVCLVTVWLFHYLTEPQDRSDTFGFTLGFLCFLEFLSFGYFAASMIPGFKRNVVSALYPAVGIVIGLYVVTSLLVIALFSFLINSPKAYSTTVILESIFFLIPLGSIVVINSYKKTEDTTIKEQRERLVDLSVDVERIHQNFSKYKSLLNTQTYRELDAKLRKLKERFRVCAPFGRLERVSIVEEEMQIQDYVALLGSMIDRIPSSPKEELGSFLEEIDELTTKTLQAMARRERLLVR